MKKVTKEQFFDVINPLDVIVRTILVEGDKHRLQQQFTLRYGQNVGYFIEGEYFLEDRYIK